MDAAVLRARARHEGRDVWLIALVDKTTEAAIYLTNETSDISYGGQTYLSYVCQVQPPSADSDGALPANDIVLCNVERDYQALLANHDWFRGGTTTLVSYNTANPSADYSDETTVSEIVNHDCDDREVVLHCGVPKEVTEQTPAASYGPWNCSHRFKDGMCGYAGADPTCPQTRQACRAKGNVARFGGEPGLRTGTVRLGV